MDSREVRRGRPLVEIAWDFEIDGGGRLALTTPLLKYTPCEMKVSKCTVAHDRSTSLSRQSW